MRNPGEDSDNGAHGRHLKLGGKVTQEIYGDGVSLKGSGYKIWGETMTPRLEKMMK